MSPEVHSWTDDAHGDQVGFIFYPDAQEVAVEVTAMDGRPTVTASVPWEDFERMARTMHQAQVESRLARD